MELTFNRRRSLWWYVKFLFACQAVVFALWLLIAIFALRFVGHKLLDLHFDGHAYVFLPLYLLAAPVVWRYLR